MRIRYPLWMPFVVTPSENALYPGRPNPCRRPSRNTSLFVQCFLVCCLLISPAYAETLDGKATSPTERPRIGVVLSGGGARGAAHVGVLKVLEELQVPVDYVVGTSLGAVVGGLYAKGHTPAELETILASLEWNRGFLDALPRSQLSFRRKDQEDKFQTNFELGLQGRSVTFPPGFLQGHGLYLLLQTLLNGASLEGDFNDLPIPYRAIATDLETSETVVIDSGDLAKAFLASMSIPAIYSPVELNGRLLVDGGVSNNLAVDAVREMGADIVIAVDISTPLSTRKQLGSVPKVLNQITSILSQQGTATQVATLQDTDVLLRPDLNGFTSADFNRVSAISAVGEEHARENASLLQSLSLTDEEYSRYREEINQTKTKELPRRIGKITLNQNTKLSEERLLLRADLEENTELSTDKLHDAINSIYSSDLFENIHYQLSQNPDRSDSADIEINANRRSWGTDRIQLGIVLEDDFRGDNNFLLSAGYTRRAINRLGGDLRVIGRIGELPTLTLEYFQPYGMTGNYFTLAQIEHEQFSRTIFDADNELESFRLSRNQLGLFTGWQNNNSLEFRLGLLIGDGDIRQRTGFDSSIKDGSFREGILELRARYDTVDNKTFPVHGQKLTVEYERGISSLNSDSDFQSISVDALFVRERRNLRWIAGLRFSDSISGSLPTQRQFSQGSILSTAGLRSDTEVGESAYRASLLAYRPLKFSRVQALENPIFYGATIEAGRVSPADGSSSTDAEAQVSGSVFVAADTPIGPILLGIGAEEGIGLTGLFSVGLTF